MPDVTPFLWFDDQAEKAAEFYISVFPNSRITKRVRRTKSVPVDAGVILTVALELDGKCCTALNGGPYFKLREAFSFVVHCKDQAEIDYYWNALTADSGEPGRCSWLKDRFGLSWQIVPKMLPELLAGDRADRVMAAIMAMTKLDISTLEAAADAF
jgi:predicted 3-demethylubiquinone-9 3-methyltransferase (glyoxalase superfamily)